MKKYIVFLFFAGLCCCSKALDRGVGGALKPLDVVPDVVINNIVGSPGRSFHLSDFKGKWVILDFWATWCSPCVNIIPRIDSLQEQFQNKIQFIAVTDQKKAVVESFLSRLEHRHPVSMIECVEDTLLNTMFGKAALPHFAWIDPTGKFVAITSDAAINKATIQSVLNGNPLSGNTAAEADISYDPMKPLFLDLNPTSDSSFIFHSILTGYKDGVGSGLYADITKADDGTAVRRITARNLTVAGLYQIALSNGFKVFGWDRTLLLVKDTTALYSKLTGVDFDNWLRDNRGFCYELIIPKQHAAAATRYMQRDLELFFPQYKAAVENIVVKCWALEVINGAVNAPTTGNVPRADFDYTGFKLINCDLNVLCRRITHYLQGYNLPVVNNTIYSGHVDLDVQGKITNIGILNDGLSKYNLHFVQKELLQEMLVIRDN